MNVNSQSGIKNYNGTYFRIALIDSTYGIITNGTPSSAYHGGGSRGKLTIKNDIGICVVMPVFIEGEPDESTIVIEVQ